ncbi:SDR family NAD(P)-dependent oxidoreductase [Variovorax paradoxus]|uniref:SDR family NAD(P)-dependent oxidoreductase n=1 Tax=Variovorax paradoxus TaxID=34073 RepID=UPI0027816BB7|nr:SDR family oxidoreductase [Variovorax paradoxus]MDP9927868.1 NAD(P)-dependent dehydrogenase (short-subunit alcohol dehydrogenase family) [Variovorax paradoxus]
MTTDSSRAPRELPLAGPHTVLLTGAGAGIGRATALALARAGWRCVLVDVDAGALRRLEAAWPADAEPPMSLVADLTDAARIERLGHEVPPLDALINNAGLSAGGAEATSGHDDGTAARLLALNLAAPARMVQACAPHLRPGARIVNVASGAGLRAIPWRGLYSPSKAGLIGQSRALAQARPDWTVTTLAPGFVRTELVKRLIEGGRLDPAQAVSKIPLGRMAEPEDMAQALCFLASPGARVLTGQMLVLDGGSSVCAEEASRYRLASIRPFHSIHPCVRISNPCASRPGMQHWACGCARMQATSTAQAIRLSSTLARWMRSPARGWMPCSMRLAAFVRATSHWPASRCCCLRPNRRLAGNWPAMPMPPGCWWPRWPLNGAPMGCA